MRDLASRRQSVPGDGDMEIRSFQDADEAEVIRLWERCGLLRSWNDPSRDIARKRDVQRDLFLVGTVDGVIVASAMAGYDGHRGWVNYLAVDPSWRRRGLGSAIMRAVEQRLTDLGCPKLNLQIRRDNLPAISFYERIGFAQEAVVSMGRRLESDDTDGVDQPQRPDAPEKS
jgi:ribosomal protein S18 acetylase RimI-like enzyme